MRAKIYLHKTMQCVGGFPRDQVVVGRTPTGQQKADGGYAVSRVVNSVKNDTPECIEAIGEPPL